MITRGRFPPRPVRAGGPTEDLPAHVSGKPKVRTARSMELFRDEAPLAEVDIAIEEDS